MPLPHAFKADPHDHQLCVDEAIEVATRICAERGMRFTKIRERVLTLVAFDAADKGIQVFAGGTGDERGPALREIVSLIQEGSLSVPIWRTFPLEETAAALQESSAGHLRGKIVVVP